MRKEPGFIAAKTVDEYLHGLPAVQRKMLEQMRKAIKAGAPKAAEVISYNIPTYKHQGPLVHFAAFKNHCSFVTVSKSITSIFEKELSGYDHSGRTIHFSVENPIPDALIKKIVQQRVKENEGLKPMKKVAKAGIRSKE